MRKYSCKLLTLRCSLSQEPPREHVPGAVALREEEEGLADLRSHGAPRDGRAPQLPGVQELLQCFSESHERR